LAGHDWGFEATFLEPPHERPLGPYPRGRLVGGTSAINATIGQRGTPADFAAWAAAGNPDWTWDQVLPFYLRIERDLDFGSGEAHNDQGPVPIFRTPESDMPPSAVAFQQACLNRGFPACADHNEPGSTGVGPLPRNQDGDLRASTLMTYLRAARERPNLTIEPNLQVHRVLFEGNRAVGVEASADGGAPRRFDADRVVLSAGVVGSPTILLHSGGGPAETLARFSIAPVSPLAGVGRNMQDHPLALVITTVSDDAPPKCGLFAALKYSSTGEGDIDLAITPALLETRSLNFKLPTDATTILVVPGVLAKARSKGWLTLVSDDPRAAPDIHLNFLADPADMTAAKASIRLIHELLTSEPLAAEIDEVLFPDRETVEDDERLEAYLRATINTGFHGVGTCRMGPAGDAGAVVGQDLSVHGTEGLYVADASIMPEITTLFTNLTCYMIGERLSDALRHSNGAAPEGPR